MSSYWVHHLQHRPLQDFIFVVFFSFSVWGPSNQTNRNDSVTVLWFTIKICPGWGGGYFIPIVNTMPLLFSFWKWIWNHSSSVRDVLLIRKMLFSGIARIRGKAWPWPIHFENSFFYWIGPKNDSIQNKIRNIHSKNIHSIESRIFNRIIQ